MRQTLTFLIIIFSFLCCNSNKKSKNEIELSKEEKGISVLEKNIDSSDFEFSNKKDSVKSILIDNIIENEDWPIKDSDIKLSFKNISKNQFEKFNSNYNSNISYNKAIKIEDKKHFILKTSSEVIKFPCDYDSYYCYHYRGFIDTLELYGIERIGKGVGTLNLLDSKTNKVFPIPSDFDNSCKMPLLSKNGNTLAFYATDAYDKQSSIYFYFKRNNEFDFSKYSSIITRDWRIEELIWIADNSLALKVYDDENDYTEIEKRKLNNIRYLKAEIE